MNFNSFGAEYGHAPAPNFSRPWLFEFRVVRTWIASGYFLDFRRRISSILFRMTCSVRRSLILRSVVISGLNLRTLFAFPAPRAKALKGFGFASSALRSAFFLAR